MFNILRRVMKKINKCPNKDKLEKELKYIPELGIFKWRILLINQNKKPTHVSEENL